MAYSYDDDDGDRDGFYGSSSGLGGSGLGGYGSGDLYGGTGGLGTRDYDSGYDTLGSAGLGGLGGLDDQLGGLSLNTSGLGTSGLGSSGLYDSGYDSALSGNFDLPTASSPYLDGASDKLV